MARRVGQRGFRRSSQRLTNSTQWGKFFRDSQVRGWNTPVYLRDENPGIFRENTLEGGTAGVGVTTGNSGGASGNAFNAVFNPSGCTQTYESDGAGGLLLRMTNTASDGGSTGWDVNHKARFAARVRFTPVSGTWTGQVYLADIRTSTGIGGSNAGVSIRLNSSQQLRILNRNGFSYPFVGTYALSVGTAYQLEVYGDFVAGTAGVKLWSEDGATLHDSGEVTGQDFRTAAFDQFRFMTIGTAITTVSEWDDYAFSLDDTPIGPIVTGGGGTEYTQGLSGGLSFAGSVTKRTSRSVKSFLTTQNLVFTDNASFEGNTLGGWVGNSLANVATLAVSTTRSLYGERSMLITWPNSAAFATEAKGNTGFTAEAGHVYRATAWVWVPSGSAAVAIGIYPNGTGTASSTNDAWEKITYTSSAVSGSGSLTLNPVITPPSGSTAGNTVFVDHVKVEDIGLVRRVNKPLTGGVSFTGSAVKRTARALAATLSFVGSFFKQTRRALSGGLSFTGSLANAKIFLRSLSGSLSFNGSGYAATVLADTPAGYWRLGEPSGSTMVDSSGNGRDGAYGVSVALGGAGLQTSDSNTSAEFFSGASSSAQVTYGAWMSSGNAFSAEAFASIDSASVSGNRTIMSIYGGSFSTARFTFRLESGVPTLYVFHGSSFSSVSGSTTLSHSTTYHLAATYDGSVAKVYVNGVEDGSSTLGVTPNAGSVELCLHAMSNNSEAFVGDLDEAAYYTFDLSPAQVADHYAARSGSSNAPLVKRTNKVISAALSFTGAVAKRTSRALSGALSFTGSAAKRTSKIFSGVLSFIGSHTPTFIAGGPILKALSGSLSFTGSQTKRAGKSLAGTLSFVGSDAFRISRSLTATLGFSGSIAKRSLRTLLSNLWFGTAPPAFVRQATAVDSVGTTALVVPITASTTGNCLVATVAVRADASRSVGSVTDTAGNTWLLGRSTNPGTGSASRIEIWYCLNAGSATSVTVNLVGGAGVKMAANVSEYSGVGGFDLANGVSGAAVTSLPSGALTPSAPNALLVAAVQATTAGGTRTFTGGGWTALTDFATAGGSDVFGSAAYIVVPTPTSSEAIWSQSSSVNYSGAVISFVPTSASALTKRTSKSLAASLSFVGSVAKRTTRSLSGALSFVGSVAKRTSRSLAGSLSFSGAVSYASIFLRSLSGALSFTGSQVKRTSKPLVAGVSFVGSQAKRTTRSLSGAVTFVGTTTKRTFRALVGSLSFAGSLVSSNTFIRALSGSLSFAGSTAKRTSRSLAGGLSFVGSTARQLTLTRALSGSLTFVGTTAKRTTRSLSGALSFVGSTAKRASKSLAGALSFVGSATRRTTRSLAGSLSFAGAVSKRTSRVFSGAVSFAGLVAKQTRRAFSAALSFTGGVVAVLNGGAQNFTKALDASLSFVGTTTKRTARSLSGSLSYVGTVTKRTAKSLAGSLSFTGVLTNVKIFLRSLSGSLSFVGSQTKRTSKSLAGAISFTGTQVKRIFSGLGSSPTNLVYNPSFEVGTGTTNANFSVPGWRVGSVGSASITSIQTINVVHGAQGVQIAVDASNANQGVLPTGPWRCSPSTKYTFSFWGMSNVAGALQSQFSDGGTNFVQADGVTWNSTSTYQVYATTTSMTRFDFTFTTAPGQTVLQLADFKRSGTGSQASKTFYVDAFQMVEGSNIIPFIDANTSSSGLSFTGLTTKFFQRPMSAALSFTGSFSKRTLKSLSGAVSFTGSQIKRVGKGISAALSFAGTTTKRTARSLSASLSFTGAHTAGRIFLKAFNATLTFTGSVAGSIIGGGARIVGRISSAIGNRRRTKATGRGMISDAEGGPGESTVDGSSTKSTVIK